MKLRLLSTVLNCAHGNEETKFSHLNSQESFGVSISVATRYDGRIESIQINTECEGAEKEGRRRGTSEKKNRAHLTSFSDGLRE